MPATVLPFPTPIRSILQPSLHARGGRPYTFIGRLAEDVAPGVTYKGPQTLCAADAAWLVERVLGKPEHAAFAWPGVPGAADRAKDYGQRVGLYAYQQQGAAFLAERDYALLADAMGVGKSCQALIAAEARLSFGVVPTPTTPMVLVLCPALAKRHWEREIKRWTGHEATVLEGLRAGALPETRYVICNYDIIHGARRRDAAGVMHPHPELPGWGPSLVGRFLVAICDESHMLRGKSSQRLKAVARLCKSIPVVWMLSGTPMPNYVRDLWSQIDLMSGGLAGPYWPWIKAYGDAHQAKYGWVDTGSSNLEELGARLAFFMLGRSTAAAALELPEKRRELFKVDVTMTAPSVREANEALSRGNAVARALRATATAKRPMVVAQAVEALQAKQKVVVFTYHREQADAVAKAIKAQVECTLLCVHGDLSPDGRDAQATVFRDAASPACFVATIDSVGMAISLVGADLVLFGDLLYEPWKLLQAEKRCHRHGSTCRVLVRYLVATGTIDEALAETVIAKLANIEEALGNDPEAGGLGGLLVEDPKTTTQIVDALFEKLKSWGAQV